ncbi:hypothetical protein KM043_005050 [Ampulex compressa]|nr:hypothetical protein KM043_005050 [Ampulex compressa]
MPPSFWPMEGNESRSRRVLVLAVALGASIPALLFPDCKEGDAGKEVLPLARRGPRGGFFGVEGEGGLDRRHYLPKLPRQTNIRIKAAAAHPKVPVQHCVRGDVPRNYEATRNTPPKLDPLELEFLTDLIPCRHFHLDFRVILYSTRNFRREL